LFSEIYILVDKHYAQNGSGVEDLNAHRRTLALRKLSGHIDESKLIFALVAFLFCSAERS
jgi:hypothetical protein